MTRGDCQAAFGAAAAADGIVFETPSRAPWLNQRGHLGLPDAALRAHDALAAIFEALDGDADAQAAKATTPMQGDFVHQPSGVMVEVDEHQHFTSHRLITLDLYPDDIEVGFDLGEYRDLCRQWAPKADRAFAYRRAAGFGERGRPRQRAYVDALRDLATSAMGRPPLVRAQAVDDDGAAAYARVRDRVRSAVGVT